MTQQQLTAITTITATLELVTGLRIGAGDSEMHIGGVDNTVIKHPHTQSPYIPGSSLKGKMRSLLEWRSGAVKEEALGWKDYEKASGSAQLEVKRILQLFGISGDAKLGIENITTIGPTRISFWDCNLNKDWEDRIREDNFSLTEVKSENRINRISGVAEHPRQTERVPAGAQFDFRLSVKKLAGDSDDLLTTVLQGLKLLELDSVGGSGSRGYGKVKFINLQIDGADAQARLNAVKPFGG
ncbi:MAG: type III-A CRISPR-associated RAMP protein Csm3 [Comamonadaceae bacterium CG_4_9_14_0_8_um_filter_60_18]|nr:MAG: type III-A CRISPR-associated RAMP protein Csm3 [Comamonadaceae bacterium CG2_30_59_20]PIW07277.1 MAG: type III-A CRISPR-associated RAMP protein Csm3 [Comamonadaceae bacterium CG17_big_fil_post_rev_8_21_14_2_50_60_13]PJC13769.1 MAG: type III-A CRISPR-associated RAMP protein Csm3 [Comamonadaceae bacterium CG_4_9_14_0_8_um_filter_60_18]